MLSFSWENLAIAYRKVKWILSWARSKEAKKKKQEKLPTACRKWNIRKKSHENYFESLFQMIVQRIVCSICCLNHSSILNSGLWSHWTGKCMFAIQARSYKYRNNTHKNETILRYASHAHQKTTTTTKTFELPSERTLQRALTGSCVNLPFPNQPKSSFADRYILAHFYEVTSETGTILKRLDTNTQSWDKTKRNSRK